MKTKRLYLLILCFLVIMLILTACGQNAESSDKENHSSSASVSEISDTLDISKKSVQSKQTVEKEKKTSKEREKNKEKIPTSSKSDIDMTLSEENEHISEPALLVSNAAVNISERTVSVDISLMNNPGLASLMFNVSYDDALVLKSVNLNNEWIGKAAATVPKPLSNPQTISIIDPTDEITGDGVLATLVFNISKEVKDNYRAAVNITYDANNVFDKNLNNVDLTVIQGTVNISK